MNRALVLYLVVWLTVGCSALAEFAAKDLLPSAAKGGVNTELVVGDKEQTVGNNLEVEADEVGKIVGGDDTTNTVVADKAQEVVVQNTNYPDWLVISLLIACLVFWAVDNPLRLWSNFKKRWTRGSKN